MTRLRSRRLVPLFFLVSILLFSGSIPGRESPSPDLDLTPFARDRLVAWCIVPFDGKKRGPAERAAMVKRLGLRRVAYDWRAEHVESFEEEILRYREHDLEFFAFWDVHDHAFELFEKHGLRPQIWKTAPSPRGESTEERVRLAARSLLPLVERTGKLGFPLGLYNHGGWGGEPENLVAVCRYLRERHGAHHVGIVYNLHHGHDHLDRFEEILPLLEPYLLCLNLNGMNSGGDRKGQKILPLGAGEHDARLLKAIARSSYSGPIGIIGHTQDDVEERLLDNLEGLEWTLARVRGDSTVSRPGYRTIDPAIVPEVSPEAERVEALVEAARSRGNPHRGALLFASDRLACLSCHRVGGHGGTLGPDLSRLSLDRPPEEIVASVLWPGREVEPAYRTHQVITRQGQNLLVQVRERDEETWKVVEVGEEGPREFTLSVADIIASEPRGTSMPEGLVEALAGRERENLFSFLLNLGGPRDIERSELHEMLHHARAHLGGPATFEYVRDPLDPAAWPNWQHAINRDRIYDFYRKQADHFSRMDSCPPVLQPFPGLDGGVGHWGNQSEEDWASDSWNRVKLDSLLGGVFRADGLTVPRGLCVRPGEEGGHATCFDPESLQYRALWQGRFLEFSSVRHGFIHGLKPGGTLLARPAPRKIEKPHRYLGLLRSGDDVYFHYQIAGREYLDRPRIIDGEFAPEVIPIEGMADLSQYLRAREPEPDLETQIHLGEGRPHAIDTIGLPFENSRNSLFFLSGHDFLGDGSALVSTMQGDVWRVSGFSHPSTRATWRRVASGLHQPQGLVVAGGRIYVLGRDQITELVDLDGDGVADYYRRFSGALETSPAGHDYICGLERDSRGRFYTASGNQGVVEISPDGQTARVVATGFRNPDGIGLLPDGTITVPCSEGSWTPASMICAFRPGEGEPPFFGFRGPRDGKVPDLPLVYLPRGLDNSSGGQVVVKGDRWGLPEGQLIHLSFGAGAHFLVLIDLEAEIFQGAVVPLVGEFLSGAHRGRFHPGDGQLYVTGQQGWGSYTPQDGCFQRVRYTGAPVQLPTGFTIHENGVRVTFSRPLEDPGDERHFAQAWNYRYSSAYGSPELSPGHPGVEGHDVLAIRSSHLREGGRELFLEIPDLQPVNQLHLLIRTAPGEAREMFVTVHRPGPPFTDFPGYRPTNKTVAPHPIELDLARSLRSVPNPHAKVLEGAREIVIETASNLNFKTRELRVRAGETLALTLVNPDVVPHNWAVVQPGALEKVGRLTTRMISDPEASLKHYIPDTPEVIAYTDIVFPGQRSTIYFRVPPRPGRYPYLCTFPGHWRVMQGVMVVE